MELPIVTTSWLQDNLQNQNLVLLDASMSRLLARSQSYTTSLFIYQGVE